VTTTGRNNETRRERCEKRDSRGDMTRRDEMRETDNEHNNQPWGDGRWATMTTQQSTTTQCARDRDDEMGGGIRRDETRRNVTTMTPHEGRRRQEPPKDGEQRRRSIRIHQRNYKFANLTTNVTKATAAISHSPQMAMPSDDEGGGGGPGGEQRFAVVVATTTTAT